MKISKYIMFAALLFVASMPLFAQRGCAESPEDPTAVLAVLSTAAGSMVFLRARLKARRAVNQK